MVIRRRPVVSERLDAVGLSTVRSLVAGEPDADGHVVLVPGLGALGYLLPTVRAIAAFGLRCSLLDLPGFGSRRPRPAAPTVGGVARTTAAWILAQPSYRRVVVMGHSTGAQAALLANLWLPDVLAPAAVVLAGPTFAPAHRRLARLLLTAPAAYRRDSPRELVVVPDFLRAGPDVLTLLRSALLDRPEDNVAAVQSPLVLTAGRHDSFCRGEWLWTLARSAARAPSVRTTVLPGSHNNPYTHPRALASLVLEAAEHSGRS